MASRNGLLVCADADRSQCAGDRSGPVVLAADDHVSKGARVYTGDMSPPKSKFPVPDFQIRGGVLKQTQRNALVRSAMTGALTSKSAAKAAGSALKAKPARKGK